MSTIYQISKRNYRELAPILPEDIISWAEESGEIRIYVIEEDEETVGCAAVELSVPRAELLWFYVTEDYRDYGIGRESFFSLLSDLRDAGAYELSAELSAGTKESFVSLFGGYPVSYEHIAACNVSFPAEEVNKAGELLKPSVHSASLRSVSKEELEALQQKLSEEGKDIMDVREEGYNPTLSTVYQKDGEALGALLFKRKGSNAVSLSFAATVSDDQAAFLDMLRYAAGMIRQLPAGTMVEMNILDQKLRDFLMTLMKDADHLEIKEGQLATLSLSYLDRLKEEAEAETELIKELFAL